ISGDAMASSPGSNSLAMTTSEGAFCNRSGGAQLLAHKQQRGIVGISFGREPLLALQFDGLVVLATLDRLDRLDAHRGSPADDVTQHFPANALVLVVRPNG